MSQLNSDEACALVRALWESFERREFARARRLLADDFTAWWPHSGELIKGADNFIAVNEHYPGPWAITIDRVLGLGDTVVSEVTVRLPPAVFQCASLFTVREGKLAAVTDYWIERNGEEPPAWRRRWTEPTELP